MNNTIVVIPHYNHSETIHNVVKQITHLGLPILIVDDGSSLEHKNRLQRLAGQPQVSLYFCPNNQGKGAAMKIGFQTVEKLGYRYAIQIDADGQHQISDISKMLKQIASTPDVLICGHPIYGNDAPKSRLYGRKITNFWNAIHTQSFQIKDGMCGFRLYPLVHIIPLIEQEFIGNRMDFDIEILIKAYWRNIPIVWLDTPIRYQAEGISHFKMWRDNWQISKMHTRLFFTMLYRLLIGKRNAK
ncbi:GT2 family glycosyltransferase [Volucribacter psittacicida]|uniref:GT2 family glycosyltransferase n=1 Tax=Volucribacter psittacicida TaxID=203482 RepID=A0A4R1G4W0_9PAST|nr:glycosyltransferase family 2 protein [Volucribacter psittacicida]TCK01533.1 GT2 family glycosyltransferase [Volucribacter psittacicida]